MIIPSTNLVEIFLLKYSPLEHLAFFQVALLKLIQIQLPLGEEANDVDRVVCRSSRSEFCNDSKIKASARWTSKGGEAEVKWGKTDTRTDLS